MDFISSHALHIAIGGSVLVASFAVLIGVPRLFSARD
jgi:hypothetical protein